MARPDMSEQRIEQILDAFEKCVANCGLEGTTLEMVAQEANVKRTLIRHYVGNRDQVLLAWAERSVRRHQHSLEELVEALPKRNRAKKLVDYLFLSGGKAKRSAIVMDLLIAHSEQHAECRKLISGLIEEMIDIVAEQLQLCYLGAAKGRCFEVASTVVAVSLCADSLSPLRLPNKYSKAWKSTVQTLVSGLES